MTMESQAACETLNIPIENIIDQKFIFNNYLKKFNDDRYHKYNLIQARNTLFREIINNQISVYGRFNIEIPQSPETCISCNGTGEKYRFMIEVVVPCPSCLGTGTKAEKCKTCNGTGAKLGRPCFTCKGKGKYFHYKNHKRKETVPCPDCKGKGDIKVKKRSKTLTDSTTCPECSGTGLNIRKIKNKNKGSLGNVVISKEAAERLKNRLDKK